MISILGIKIIYSVRGDIWCSDVCFNPACKWCVDVVVNWLEQTLYHTACVTRPLQVQGMLCIFTLQRFKFLEQSFMLFSLTTLKIKIACSIPKTLVLILTSVVKFWFSYCNYNLKFRICGKYIILYIATLQRQSWNFTHA
jgi:hypothetical protein